MPQACWSLVTEFMARTVGIMAWRIQSTVEATKSSDPLYDIYFTTLQSHLEIWLGIIGASLPTLAPIASKLIMPAVYRFISSHRKSGSSSGRRENPSRTIGGGGGDVQLQDLGFTRLDGESLIDSTDAQHWGVAEATRAEGDLDTAMHGDDWSGRPDAITVRHDYEVSAEPRQQV